MKYKIIKNNGRILLEISKKRQADITGILVESKIQERKLAIENCSAYIQGMDLSLKIGFKDWVAMVLTPKKKLGKLMTLAQMSISDGVKKMK